VWIGLAVSALGDELYRVAAIWLAVEVAGTHAVFVPTSQYAAIFAMTLTGTAFASSVPPWKLMITADLLRAAVALMPVLAWATYGLTLSVLVFTSIALAALRGLFDPALYSIIARLAKHPTDLPPLNGLFDATMRSARLVGPVAAGTVAAVLPAIHLISANAASFLVSAGAVASIRSHVRRQLPPAADGSKGETGLQQLRSALVTVRRVPGLGIILAVNTVSFAAWILAVSVGLPLLIAEQAVDGHLTGLSTLAVVMTAYGAGDLLANIIVVARVVQNPPRFMFTGYLLLGGGLACLPVAVVMPPSLRLATLVVIAFVSATGGPMFFVHMMTTLQTSIDAAQLIAVLRLRMITTAAATVAAGVAAPALFASFGVAATITICGLAIAVSAAWGVVLASPKTHD
jgi:hypothetical protein